MGMTREQLSPSARAFYDAQKRQPGRPSPLTTTAASPGPLPSPIATRVRKGIRDSKAAVGEFMNICDKAGVEKPVTEFVFHPSRKWRMDYAWPRHKLALEVDGGVFIGGGHNRGKGFKEDNEKINSAIVLGWRVLKCTPQELLTFETVDMVRRAMRGGAWR